MNDMWRKIMALIAICVGSVVVAMYFVNIHYDGRIEEVHRAHSNHVRGIKAQNTRERKEQREEIADRLDRIERLLIQK